MLPRGLALMSQALGHVEKDTLSEFLGSLTDIELAALITVGKSLETSAYLSFSDVFMMSKIVSEIEEL